MLLYQNMYKYNIKQKKQIISLPTSGPLSRPANQRLKPGRRCWPPITPPHASTDALILSPTLQTSSASMPESVSSASSISHMDNFNLKRHHLATELVRDALVIPAYEFDQRS